MLSRTSKGARRRVSDNALDQKQAKVQIMADREAVVVLGARLTSDGSCTALLAARIERGVAVYKEIGASPSRGSPAPIPDFICTGYNSGERAIVIISSIAERGEEWNGDDNENVRSFTSTTAQPC